jgi:hypothetical protein
VDEGEVVVGFAIAAGRDSWFGFQPGVGAFDWPAVAGLRVGDFEPSLLPAPDFAYGGAVGDWVAGAAWLADPGFDLALAQRMFDRLGGVAAVGPELARPDPLREQLIDQRDQVALLVFVSGREADRERCPVGVYGEVVAAARRAAECARDLFAPFFASTSEASTISRDQSSRPASKSSACKT